MREQDLWKRQELLLTAMGITMQKIMDMLSPVDEDEREKELLKEHDLIRDRKVMEVHKR